MNLETLFTLIIVSLGSVTVILSIIVANTFKNFAAASGLSSKLSHAIKWQLAGEAVIGFGTLIFAILAHYELLGNLSTIQQSAIRVIMFAATSVTTLHLWMIVHALKRKK